MTKKQIIIIVGVVLAVAGLTFGGILLFRMLTNVGQDTDQKSSDPTIFNNISGVEALPQFSQLPKEQNGWIIEENETDATFGYVRFVNDSQCSVEFISQRTPYTDTTLSDYELSKQLAESLAAGELATLEVGDSITLKSSAGNTDFYVGTYSPKVLLKTNNTGTNPTTEGGTTNIKEPYKTFVAVRTVGDALKSVDSFNDDNSVDDSEYKEGEIQKTKESVPSIVIKYQCAESSYDFSDALDLFDQLEINFTPAEQATTDSTTIGK